jgi:hypothetical protein
VTSSRLRGTVAQEPYSIAVEWHHRVCAEPLFTGRCLATPLRHPTKGWHVTITARVGPQDWDVEAPTFSRQSVHRQRWGCQPHTPAALHSQKIPGTYFSASGRIREYVKNKKIKTKFKSYPLEVVLWYKSQVCIMTESNKRAKSAEISFDFHSELRSHIKHDTRIVTRNYRLTPLQHEFHIAAPCWKGRRNPYIKQSLMIKECWKSINIMDSLMNASIGSNHATGHLWSCWWCKLYILFATRRETMNTYQYTFRCQGDSILELLRPWR